MAGYPGFDLNDVLHDKNAEPGMTAQKVANYLDHGVYPVFRVPYVLHDPFQFSLKVADYPDYRGAAGHTTHFSQHLTCKSSL